MNELERAARKKDDLSFIENAGSDICGTCGGNTQEIITGDDQRPGCKCDSETPVTVSVNRKEMNEKFSEARFLLQA